MQTEIKNFARDFKKEIGKSKFKSHIVSVILLGSAARGEFIKGESDIDMIVVVKNSKDKKQVTVFVAKILDKLNKRYDLKLEETCTDKKKYRNEILNIFLKIEASVFFGVPFYVIAQDEYDFVKNKMHSKRIWFMATFMLSLNEFLLSIKNTAKTIYGKDLLHSINVDLTFADRIKIYAEQIYIMIAAFLFFPFSRKLALKHAIKASLYQEEFDLLLLDKHITGYIKDKELFESTFSKDSFAIKHLKRSIYLRKNYNRINVSATECLKFMISTFRFISVYPKNNY